MTLHKLLLPLVVQVEEIEDAVTDVCEIDVGLTAVKTLNWVLSRLLLMTNLLTESKGLLLRSDTVERKTRHLFPTTFCRLLSAVVAMHSPAPFLLGKNWYVASVLSCNIAGLVADTWLGVLWELELPEEEYAAVGSTKLAEEMQNNLLTIYLLIFVLYRWVWVPDRDHGHDSSGQ